MPWAQILIWVVTTIVDLLFGPREQQNKPQPQTQEGFPEAEAGTTIPKVFGTRLLNSPNVVWWGDVQAVAIKEKPSKKG